MANLYAKIVKERGFTLEGAKKKLKESASDMIIANDIGTSRKTILENYKKNYSKKNIVFMGMGKEKIAKIIRKQIELKLKLK